MLIRFFKWFRGYLLVQLNGYSPERFINLCRNRNILIWDMCKAEDGYQCYMTLKGFRTIRPIAKKTKTKVWIVKRFGMPFFVHKMFKHKGFLLGICLFAAIVYTLSLFIWDITLEGNHTYTEDIIFKYLREIQVEPGVMKRKLSCQDIEASIRKKYPDIGWVSAEIKGTKLNLKIVETNMPVPYDTSTTPCHLVASHDGVVYSIITRQGTPMVKKGSAVKKGDIIVSGVIDIILDNAEVINKEPVVADADVLLETTYEYNKKLPIQYQKHVYTGRKKKVFSVSVLSHTLNLQNPLKKLHSTKKYDIISTEKNLKLTHSFVLPVQFRSKTYKEYKEEPASYSKEELVAKQNAYFSLYVEQLRKEGVQIKENHVKIKMDQKNCVSSGTLTVLEPVNETKKINETEWRIKKPDEHSGNDT